MSAPLKRTRPAFGGKTPEIALNKVVLPAPFGPINAVTCRPGTSNDTSEIAVRPPKRRVNRSTVSILSAPAALSHGCSADGKVGRRSGNGGRVRHLAVAPREP